MILMLAMIFLYSLIAIIVALNALTCYFEALLSTRTFRAEN